MTSLRCLVQPVDEENKFIIKILVDDINEYNFSVDSTEINNKSFALILALTDVLQSMTLIQPLHIYVQDLFVYNMLSKNIYLWKQNNWILKTGKPLPYVDILSSLYDELLKITFIFHWDK